MIERPVPPAIGDVEPIHSTPPHDAVCGQGAPGHPRGHRPRRSGRRTPWLRKSVVGLGDVDLGESYLPNILVTPRDLLRLLTGGESGFLV